MLRTAERVLTVLGGPGSLLPEGSPVRVDAGKTASELEQAAGALRRALPEVELRLAEAGLMRQRREAAEAVFEADCAAGLRLLTAVGAYGGNKEMAGRMRGERVRAR